MNYLEIMRFIQDEDTNNMFMCEVPRDVERFVRHIVRHFSKSNGFDQDESEEILDSRFWCTKLVIHDYTNAWGYFHADKREVAFHG